MMLFRSVLSQDWLGLAIFIFITSIYLLCIYSQTIHSQKSGNFKPRTIVRSQSDTNANLLSSHLRRQHSQASSDHSNNSEELFADGIYQGM